jgi:inhibitor of cysteine peptidase
MMLRKILCILVFVCLLVSAAGCGSMQAKVTSNDDGKQLNVRVGEKIVVTLDGNPSTGYTWDPKELDASMIQQVGSTDFKSGNPGLVGAGGTLTLTFKLLKPGTTVLTLIYHRPWETDVEPLHSYTITIIVK